ncbi:unnamed protein product [Allacma fusca]|uniref:Uncharacterized protein n=1 Tax=Allacma fusca TaxID=39272 RepID=A0A8J2LV21_9HEXA|nr:unnamed protein product [Allacma fusca]
MINSALRLILVEIKIRDKEASEFQFRNKALHTRPIEPTTFVKMESVPLTPPVLQGTNASVKEKAKTNPTMTSSLADATTASRMGPGGETLKQQPGSPCSNNDTEKDASFRTPSESNSELNTESDVSFVMCESTEELSTSLKKCKIDDKSPSDSAPATNSSPADNKTVQKGAKCPETIVLPSSQETAEVTTELSKSSDTATIHAGRNYKRK